MSNVGELPQAEMAQEVFFIVKIYSLKILHYLYFKHVILRVTYVMPQFFYVIVLKIVSKKLRTKGFTYGVDGSKIVLYEWPLTKQTKWF